MYDEFVATVPEDYSPLPNENGDLEIRDKGTVIARMPKGGFYLIRLFIRMKGGDLSGHR